MSAPKKEPVHRDSRTKKAGPSKDRREAKPRTKRGAAPPCPPFNNEAGKVVHDFPDENAPGQSDEERIGRLWKMKLTKTDRKALRLLTNAARRKEHEKNPHKFETRVRTVSKVWQKHGLNEEELDLAWDWTEDEFRRRKSTKTGRRRAAWWTS